MKRNIVLVLVAIIVAVTSACSYKSNESKRCIMVSIPVYRYFLERIVGNEFDIKCMLSKGGNPETYDPAMTYMMNLEKSDAYFLSGNLGFEISIKGKIRNFNSDIKIVDTSKGIDLIRGSHNFGGHDKDGVDPHIWTSVVNVRIIVKNMLVAVCELDPGNKELYEDNYKKFDAELSAFYDDLKNKLSDATVKTFVVWHPSLSYFARDFGFEQISMEHSGQESTMKYFEERIGYGRDKHAKVFFVEPNMDRDRINTVSEQIGTRLVDINPLDYDWKKQLNIITDALSSK